VAFIYAASDKIYQLLVHGRWFSPATPASSTTKTGRHEIAEILLKVALNTKSNQIQITRIVNNTNIFNTKKENKIKQITRTVNNIIIFNKKKENKTKLNKSQQSKQHNDREKVENKVTVM
jgi:hypothetical protein